MALPPLTSEHNDAELAGVIRTEAPVGQMVSPVGSPLGLVPVRLLLVPALPKCSERHRFGPQGKMMLGRDPVGHSCPQGLSESVDQSPDILLTARNCREKPTDRWGTASKSSNPTIPYSRTTNSFSSQFFSPPLGFPAWHLCVWVNCVSILHDQFNSMAISSTFLPPFLSFHRRFKFPINSYPAQVVLLRDFMYY